MSEKKALQNVWLVQDQCPGEDGPRYFAGYAKSDVTGNDVSRFEPLSADTKVYKDERCAKIGACRAAECYESPFITPVFVEYADLDPLMPVPENERPGWLLLNKLCEKYPLMMLMKKVGGVVRYAIAFSESDIRYLPADPIYAWKRYFSECESFLTDKIRKQRIAEGKDPDGADDWKKGSGE